MQVPIRETREASAGGGRAHRPLLRGEDAGSLRSSRHRRKVSRWHHSGRRRLRARAQACENWRRE